MIPDKNIPFEDAPPNPGSLIEAMRASGYDFETAVADIIDNSISARAKLIRVTVFEDGRRSWVAIADDGSGMDCQTLKRAMVVGGVDPNARRELNDLGRFGLGLKTASLSQCRQLTVFTKPPKGNVSVCCWDIDLIKRCGKWALVLQSLSPILEDRFKKELGDQQSGTVVLWESLDRVIHDAPDAAVAQRLQRRLPRLEQHLGMVFHRFLEEDGLRIQIGDVPIKPWDPFMRKEKATQMLSEEILRYLGSAVSVRPYVLPHTSKTSAEMYRVAAGPRKWVDHQGFYLYRNRRLLVAGSWLNLGFTKEDYNKLVRIQVDFGNDLDFAWDINVRKSRAVPPDALREDFIRIAKKTREVAKSIFKHRGAVIARQLSDQVFLWEKHVQHGKTFYRINPKHHAVIALLKSADSHGLLKETKGFLRLMEQTIPVPLILIDGYEKPEEIGDPIDPKAGSEVSQLFSSFHAALCASGQSPNEAFKNLAVTEPFFRWPEIVAAFKEQHAIGD